MALIVREHVPSARESGARQRLDTQAPAPPARRRRRAPSDYDPRAITRAGPTFPLVALALASLVTQWDDQVLGIVLPQIRAELAIDLALLVTLQSLMGVLLNVAAPAFGFLADRLSRVWMLRVGQVVSNASSVATGLAGSVGGFAAARVGVNAGSGVLEPAGLPLLADLYPPSVRTRLFSVLTLVGYAGAIAGPIVGGSIAAAFGWRAALISLGGLALAVTVLLFFVREPRRGEADRRAAGVGPAAPERPIGWREGWRAARAIATVRRMWWSGPFFGAVFLVNLGLMNLYYAEEFGASVRTLGLITSVNFGAGIVALAVFGPLADRLIGARPGRVMTLLGAGLVVQAAAFVGLWAAPGLAVAVAINATLSAITATFYPVTASVLSLAIPPRIRGFGTMSIRPWFALGGAIAGPITGAIAAAEGFRAVMLAVVPACLIGAAIIGTAARGVERDIRAARAALTATEVAHTSDALLVCRGVEVAFGGVQVLFGVDLDVHEGEIVALLGTNGAGKSTLLRAIAGIDPATGGAIVLGGREATYVPGHELARDGVVLLPGGRAVFPTLTVAENLRAAGADTEQACATFPALRARLGQVAATLSGGEQQMLGLAQAFAMRPRLLLIDELSLGLAPAVVAQLLDEVRRIHAGGTTIMLVEQSVELALEVAERAVFLERGEVAFDGPSRELLARGDLVRSVFLGGAVTGRDLTDVPARDEGAALRVEGARVSFGGVRALDGVDVTLTEHDIVGIVGSNGAGKTTLFDAISGFTVLDEGRVLLGDRDVTDLGADARARLGIVRSFQDVRLFPTMSVRECVAIASERHLGRRSAVLAAAWWPAERSAEAALRARADDLLSLVGLSDVAERPLAELSTAMRRVADLACMIAAEPRVLLLDEPSSGLARAEVDELGPLLKRLVRETGCALALIEHDLALVERVCDRIITMNLGKVE